jgi:hypothetical protein
MNTKTFKQLDILGGGLRLSDSKRKVEGVLKFNNQNKKFEVFTGEKDIDGNEWIDIVPSIASESNLGDIKIGNNLFINPLNGVANAISVGPSMFYQHIVTVSKYNIPFEQHVNTGLPDGSIIKGGSGDFTTITDAINFIETLDSNDYPRNSENQWLIYIAPGLYKENFTLLPFISIKGYGKSVTILTPEENHINQINQINHINLTTNTAIFDISIKFENNLDIQNNVLINVDTSLGRDTIPTDEQIFNNLVLLKNIDITVSGVNSFTCVNVESGNLNFEDNFISVEQDEIVLDNDNIIYGFNIKGGSIIDINEGKFNFIINRKTFTFCETNNSNLTMVNSFVDIKENINNTIENNSVSNIINSLSSNCEIRNCQLTNNTINGNIFTLKDSTDRDLLVINKDEIASLKKEGGILTLISTNESTRTNILNKLNGKRGLKIDEINYKISHIKNDENIFTITLDNDRYLLDETIIFDETITIDILSLNSIANSYLRGTKYIIDSNSDNFLIENNDVSKEQGDYNILGNSLVEFNDFNVIHVSNDKGDFNTIGQALESLGKLDPNLKYLIKVHTGRYIEDKVINLIGKSNVNIIGDSWTNTEIEFKLKNIPDNGILIDADIILIDADNGLIENLKLIYKGDVSNETGKVSIINYSGKTANLNYIKFEIESNNINVINLKSCGEINNLSNCIEINHLSNLDLDIKYFLKDTTDTVTGINAIDSNLLELDRVNIKIIKSLDEGTLEVQNVLTNLNLMNTRITAKDINFELTTELPNCNLIKNNSDLTNNYKNYIFGNSLLLNSSVETNYILKNQTDDRFIIINSNILGDFNGNNIFTTGSVLLNSENSEVYSYHTTLLSNNKDSILIGNYAGLNTMGNEGNNNILIGKESGKNISSGSNNVLLGNYTGKELDGNKNILLGNNAGYNLKNNDESVMIGYKSGFNTQKKNLFLGTYAGYNITGQDNIVLGNTNENVNVINVNDNIFIGNDSGIESTGNRNICLGEGSGIVDNGSNNVNIGSYTASKNKYSDIPLIEGTGYNVNIGHMAGRNTIDSSKSINIGGGSGELSLQDENINIGFKAGRNLSGTKNVSIGNETLIGQYNQDNPDNQDTISNVVIGDKAGKNILSKQNVVIGAETGPRDTKKIGDDNILIGFKSGNEMGGNDVDGPKNNILMGTLSGNKVTGNDNIYMGNNSGSSNVLGDKNVFMGVESGSNISSGNNGVILGYNAGNGTYNDIDGDILIGAMTGSNITGTQNTIVGFEGGKKAGSNNSLFGYNTGTNLTGDYNTILGSNSGKEIKSNYNIVIGDESLTSTSTEINTDGNIVIGSQACNKLTSGGNVYIGYKSGINNDGENNTIIGDGALSFTTDISTKNNTIIGKDAGKNFKGDQNLIIGSAAGSGSVEVKNIIKNNILLGYNAGKLNNKYNNLLIIGNNSGTSITDSKTSYYTESENLIIGNNSITELKSFGNMVIGNNVGNSITDVGNNNTDVGNNNTDVGNNNLIGEKTGYNLTTGGNNIFIGNSRSLIYKYIKKEGEPFDLNNVYYSNDNDGTWSLSGPDKLSNNTKGNIEFIAPKEETNTKIIGIKSNTTFNNYRFDYIVKNNIKNERNLITLDNFKNKNFIKNFGGNNWGVYKDKNNKDNDILDNITINYNSHSFTSSQIYYDLLNNTTYKSSNCPIKFSPDDILKVNFTPKDSIELKEIIIKVYAIVQVIQNDDVIDLVNITISDLNGYDFMDERLYFDILKDDTNALSGNFMIDDIDDIEFTMTHISSAGYYNRIGNENLFLGISSGNSNLGEKNINIGFKAGKNSSIGNNNTILGNNAGEFLGDGENNTIIGQNAGQYLASTGNTIIGRDSGKNIENQSNNILIGEESGKTLGGSGNILIGNKAGINLVKNNLSSENNVIIGHNSKYTSSNGDNNVIIGNGLDNLMDNSLVIGNKKITFVRDTNVIEDTNDIGDAHLYIPVDNAQIFGYDELLKVYSLSSPDTFNYLNTVKNTDYYIPYKSIIHTFPFGQCSIEKNGDNNFELRDYSKQLSFIDFLPKTNIVKDLNPDEFDYKRPIISLKIIGDSTNNGIYEIQTLPDISNSEYDFIEIKKINSVTNNFDNVIEDTTSYKENIQIQLDNNILILSPDNPYGRIDGGAKNIFGGIDVITISKGMYIEKIVSATTNEISLVDQNYIIEFDKDIRMTFAIGDQVVMLWDTNTGFVDDSKLDAYIIGITYNETQLSSEIKLSNITNTGPANLNLADSDIRIIKVNTKNNPFIGNFNNNKVVFNGDKDDLINEKATVTVKGSIGLTDFLLLKKTTNKDNIELNSGEGIIWLEEDEDGEPILKLNYKNKKYDILLSERIDYT